MEYTSPAHKALNTVEAYILQGPVSDRGAITMEMEETKLEESLEIAKKMIANDKGHERMPVESLPASFRGTPISAFRWRALGAAEYVALIHMFVNQFNVN